MLYEGDSRLWQGLNAEDILAKANAKKIIPYLVRMTGTRSQQKGWREAIHAKLWDGLTPQQQNAWEAIYFAYTSMCCGTGYRTMRYDDSRGSRTTSDDYGAAMHADYQEWANTVRHRRMRFDMIINIVVGGMSIAQAAKEAGCRRTICRLSLGTALDIFSDMKGWR